MADNTQITRLFLFAALSLSPALGQPYKVEKTITLGGSGGWDYLTADGPNHRLYISHATEVVVVDLQSEKVIGHIPGMQRIHGIALDQDSGLGFISDGGSNQVVSFKLSDLSVAKKIPVGQNPDAILYDSTSKRVFTFNGKSQDASVVDPAAGTVTGTIKLGGKPEFAVADEKGSVFVNLEDKNEIVHLNAAKATVEHHWSIRPCDSPSGLAMDRASFRLFSVCDNEYMTVTDARSGKVIATPHIGKGPDATAFDSGRKIAFSSNGEDGTLSVVKEISPTQYEVVQTLKTVQGARTMALDETTHRVYTVSADFGPAPAPTSQTPHPRLAIKADSFKLLVIGE